jgi:hypothetical protein
MRLAYSRVDQRSSICLYKLEAERVMMFPLTPLTKSPNYMLVITDNHGVFCEFLTYDDDSYAIFEAVRMFEEIMKYGL